MIQDALISVVIPCYNHEKYIRKTVMSVLEQTYANVEILVADDCSTDNSAAILMAIKDPRLKVFCFEKNRGTVQTLNFLLEQATGAYIATLGSDDYFAPDKLEKQIEVMRNNPSFGAVFSWAEIVDENEMVYTSGETIALNVFEERNRTQGEWIRYLFDDGNHFCHSSAMIRREVQDSIGLYAPAYRQLHDFEYWLRLLCKYPVYVIPEKLTFYRRQNECNSVSATSHVNMMRHFNECALIFRRLFERMDVSLFLSAFADQLNSQHYDDELQFRMDKYRVLRSLNFAGCSVRASAYELFACSCENINSSRLRDENYQVALRMFYDDMSKSAVEYPVGESALQTLFPDLARHYENVFHSTKEENIRLASKVANLEREVAQLKNSLSAVYESTSWKVTEPLRRLASVIKR